MLLLRYKKGINRNIVECKDWWYGRCDLSGNRINRNIVECKEHGGNVHRW